MADVVLKLRDNFRDMEYLENNIKVRRCDGTEWVQVVPAAF